MSVGHVEIRGRCFVRVFEPPFSWFVTHFATGPVKDYRTHVSGVTPELLEQGVPFEEAREMVRQIVMSDTVVVGHSLNNDLNVMRLQHWHIIDTAMIFAVPSLGARTFALRVSKESGTWLKFLLIMT